MTDRSALDFWAGASPPSLDDVAALADAALKRLPEPFRSRLDGVQIQVADFADGELLDEMGLEDAFELSGVYMGVDLSRRSVLDPQPDTATILLFRRPILDEWAENGAVTLGELVEHVLIHEIGHHFGLSDEDIHAAEED